MVAEPPAGFPSPADFQSRLILRFYLQSGKLDSSAKYDSCGVTLPSRVVQTSDWQVWQTAFGESCPSSFWLSSCQLASTLRTIYLHGSWIAHLICLHPQTTHWCQSCSLHGCCYVVRYYARAILPSRHRRQESSATHLHSRTQRTNVYGCAPQIADTLSSSRVFPPTALFWLACRLTYGCPCSIRFTEFLSLKGPWFLRCASYCFCRSFSVLKLGHASSKSSLVQLIWTLLKANQLGASIGGRARIDGSGKESTCRRQSQPLTWSNSLAGESLRRAASPALYRPL